MRHFIVKWSPLLLVSLILSGSYLYNLYSPWSRYWLDGKEFWYKLLWKGEKVGYVQVNYDQLDNNIFQIKQLTRVSTTNRGEFVTFVEKEVFQFEDKDTGSLISLSYHRQQDDYLEQTQLSRIENVLSGTKQIDNKLTNISFALNEYSLADHLALMHWANEQPDIGETLVAQRFDLSELALKPVTYTLFDNNLLGGELNVEFREEGKSWTGTVKLNITGTPEKYAVGQQVEQQLSTKELALSDNSVADYYQSQIIRVDKPLGNAVQLTSLILQSPFSHSDIINDSRQILDANGILHLKKSNSPKYIKNSDITAFILNPEVDDLTIALAYNIIGKSTTVEEKVSKLLSFVSSYIKDTPVIRPMSVAMILEQRKGDCTEHTELFIALARAVSIPAREVKGLVYLGDGIQGFGGHVWSEVIIKDKWISVDPTWNLQQLSATHIQLDNESANKIFNEMHKDSKLSFTLKSAEYL
ncbi:MAG: transglutaminase domain-containing protein [Gammaproteobacteria bacterium]|nr:transglutaminase domain-containing protein [Gammaproteobacteria bacterium]